MDGVHLKRISSLLASEWAAVMQGKKIGVSMLLGQCRTFSPFTHIQSGQGQTLLLATDGKCWSLPWRRRRARTPPFSLFSHFVSNFSHPHKKCLIVPFSLIRSGHGCASVTGYHVCCVLYRLSRWCSEDCGAGLQAQCVFDTLWRWALNLEHNSWSLFYLVKLLSCSFLFILLTNYC